MIKKNGLNVLKELEFPDHYNYTKKDINNILNEAKNLNCEIITTEKDYFRINNKNLDKIKIMKSELQIIDENKLIEAIIN
jgi:tetraacyldisaccharide 4'-kinase